MKKIILSVIACAMLLSNVVIASAATSNERDARSNASIVSVTDYTVFHPQTTDPDGW